MLANGNVSLLELFDEGCHDLIPIIPFDAALAPGSTIDPKSRGKTPGIRNAAGWLGMPWRDHETTRLDVENWTAQGASFGLRTRNHPTIDVDVENPALAAELVAELESLFGSPLLRRTGRPPRFAIPCQTDELFSKIVYTLRTPGDASPSKELSKVEVLADGQQVVISGIHPSGRPYSWTDGQQSGGVELLAARGIRSLPRLTADIAQTHLFQAVQRVANRHGLEVERSGGGHRTERAAIDQQSLKAPAPDLLGAAVSCIPNDGSWDDRGRYVTMLIAIKAAGADDEAASRAIALEWASRWENGSNDPDIVTRDWNSLRPPYSVGWSFIADHARAHGFSDAALDFEVVGIATEENEPLAKFNRRYAIVRGIANAVLDTPERGPVAYHPLTHWKTIVANEKMSVPTSKGGLREEPVSKQWLEWPGRRTYGRVVQDPRSQPLTGIPSPNGGDDFNIWPGFATTPSAEGDCRLFLEHLRAVVCTDVAELYDWTITWFAQMVQQPEELPGTALVLRGAQGAGKSVVGEIIGAMLGERLYTTVSSPEELTGRFNSHHEGRVMMQVEEGFFAGQKETVGRLKNIITAPTVRIERKHVDSFTLPNFARLLITSNESWVVPASDGERRFMVLDVSDARANDLDYFAAMRRQMFDEGGVARLLHHLLSEVTVNRRLISRPLATDALRDQQIASMDPERRWLLDILTEGAIPGDDRGDGVARTDDVLASYQRFMQVHGAGRRVSSEALGRLLIKHGVTKERRRTAGQRPYSYFFPSLAQCRSTFARALVTAPEWGDVAEWQGVMETIA